MNKWMVIVGSAAVAIAALGAVGAVALTGGDGEPEDVQGDGGPLSSAACAQDQPDCDDMLEPGQNADEQLPPKGDEGGVAQSTGMCAPDRPDCEDIAIEPGTNGEGTAGIAVGEYNPNTPRPSEPLPVREPSATSEYRDAPIVGVDLLIMESFPVQYAVQITSGLPNGCAQFGEIEWAREGNVIKILVINQVDDGAGTLACSMSYGMVDNTIQLGTDFEPGETYILVINGEEEEFVAQ